MRSSAPVRYMFDRFVLSTERGALLERGAERPLRAKSFALLCLFVDNPGRLLDRNEIMLAVWPGTFVSDDSIAQCVKDIRGALGDEAKELVRTVPRRGYLFEAEVRREPAAAAEAGAAETERGPLQRVASPTLPDDLAIAVLPFQNIGADPEQDYFVDGMVEEIITALSRIRWLRVVPRVSSFSYKGYALDMRQVGRELRVRYVLEGSVRKAGESLRVTGRLIDTETVEHLWIDRFDGSVRDVFDIQDRVASSVAGVIEPALQAAEAARGAARAAARPTEDLTAYDLYLRGFAILMGSWGKIPEAVRLLDQAIARDAEFGQALGWAAVGLARMVGDGRSDDPARDRAKATDYAVRALAVARDDPNILVNAANVLVWFGEDIGAMLALVDRALAINPNFARGWHVSGLLRLRNGDLEAAIAHSETSLRLSPRGGDGGSTRLNIGAAHLFAGRFEQALPILLMAIQADPTDPHPHRYLAACYAHLGRVDEARRVVARLQALGDPAAPNLGYLRHEAYREVYRSGLALAWRLATESVADAS